MRRVVLALIAACAIAVFAVPAGAAPGDTITVTGGSGTGTIVGLDQGQPFADLGGVVLTTGGPAYCADIGTLIKIGDTVEEVPWDQLAGGDLAPSALPAVAAITNYEYPQDAGFSLEGSNQDKALGVQAAIWHFTNGFELSQSTSDNSAATIANYNTVLERVATKAYPSLKTKKLTVTPASATTDSGLAGPYTVTSSTGSAKIALSGGTLADAAGDPLGSDTVADGATFYVKSETTATVTITATTQVPKQSALAYNTPGIQRLVAAQVTFSPLEATAEASFTSTTPSTSVGPNTTVRPPTTSVGPNVTTAPNVTVAPVAVQGAQVTGSLPRTGGDMGAAPLGFALLGAGLLLVAIQQRMKAADARATTR